MTVRSILNTKGHQIMSVEPDAKLAAAIKLLGEKKIGAVLVMNQSRLEGILSERDIVRVIGERGAGALDEPVSQVMTRKVVTCKETDTVAELMETMTTGKFRHLPVIDNGKVVGLISIGDIVKRRVQEYGVRAGSPARLHQDGLTAVTRRLWAPRPRAAAPARGSPPGSSPAHARRRGCPMR
ncbi:CBS domain-containing protein [Bradyrhizobium diazoefficiens]